MAKPDGKGETADALIRAAGGDDVNIVQWPITMPLWFFWCPSAA
jgi:hypothetical protein